MPSQRFPARRALLAPCLLAMVFCSSVPQTMLATSLTFGVGALSDSTDGETVVDLGTPTPDSAQTSGGYRVTRERTASHVARLIENWRRRRSERQTEQSHPSASGSTVPGTVEQPGDGGTSTGPQACAAAVACSDSAVHCMVQAATCDFAALSGLLASSVPLPRTLPAPSEGLMWGVVLLCLLGIARLLQDLLLGSAHVATTVRLRLLNWVDHLLLMRTRRDDAQQQRRPARRRRPHVQSRVPVNRPAPIDMNLEVTRDALYRDDLPRL